MPVPQGARCLVAGIDLVRDAEGTYRVLEDNLRNPSGISYVLENRAALTRVLPQLFGGERVRPVDQLRAACCSTPCSGSAPRRPATPPTVVVLTPGIYNSAYFEHVFLATQMGVELVEGRDLVVDDHVVSHAHHQRACAASTSSTAASTTTSSTRSCSAPTRRSACRA